jgi:hypothetical protein
MFPWVRSSLVLPLALAAGFAAEPPDAAPDGVPYAWIDAAPSLGTVQAINPEYAFVIIKLTGTPPDPLRPGVRVAFRRDGVAVGQALVDRIEAPRTLIAQVRSGRVAIGDAVIFYPPAPPK